MFVFKKAMYATRTDKPWEFFIIGLSAVGSHRSPRSNHAKKFKSPRDFNFQRDRRSICSDSH